MTAIRDDIITSRLSLKRSFRGHLIITPSLGPNHYSGTTTTNAPEKIKLIKIVLVSIGVFLVFFYAFSFNGLCSHDSIKISPPKGAFSKVVRVR